MTTKTISPLPAIDAIDADDILTTTIETPAHDSVVVHTRVRYHGDVGDDDPARGTTTISRADDVLRTETDMIDPTGGDPDPEYVAETSAAGDDDIQIELAVDRGGVWELEATVTAITK